MSDENETGRQTLTVKHRLIYSLNKHGYNYVEAHVQPGRTDSDARTPDSDCEEIARTLAHRYNTHGELLAALQEEYGGMNAVELLELAADHVDDSMIEKALRHRAGRAALAIRNATKGTT